MVSKCRYSSGWNLGLNRGEECHTKQATKNSKISARQARKSSQAVLLDSAFTNTFYSHSSFTADLSNAYSVDLSPSTIAPQGYLKTQIDSGKTTQKSKKKKRNLLRRYLLNDYSNDDVSNNTDVLGYVFVIAIAILWGIYSLIRLIVRAHRKKAAQINTATVSPKSAQSLGAKDSDEKLRDQNPQTTFAVNSVAKPAIEQPESTDEVADVKKGKKSKVEKLASVISLVIILASLGYGLIDLLQRLFN